MKAIIAVPATLALVYRAHSHKSLTPLGIVAATLSAIAHAVHPWNMPFALLIIFFLAGTRVTKIKKNAKAKMTVASQGTSGGEGPRTHIQVLANSSVASVLSLLHAYQLHQRKQLLLTGATPRPQGAICLAWAGDLLPIGIMANYAVMAADTFSSELGILSSSSPRLIVSPTLRKVPRGTNGGVTLLGLAAGLLGSMIIAVATVFFTPLCTSAGLGSGRAWTPAQRSRLMVSLAVWGALGSVVDSVLGALFQRTVKDTRSGKVVEGEGGVRVLVSSPGVQGGVTPSQTSVKLRAGIKSALLHGEGSNAVEVTASTGAAAGNTRRSSVGSGDGKSSRVVESGWDLLDNNGVNFLTALTMSIGAMGVAAWHWQVPYESILRP